VYSTCSLSETENDRVIERTTKKSKEAIEIVRLKWSIGEPTKYGWIVLPDTADRWGPIYFCILRRLVDKPSNNDPSTDSSDDNSAPHVIPVLDSDDDEEGEEEGEGDDA
jgi:hypothetical protein